MADKKILIVDDSNMERELIKVYLEELNTPIKLYEASNGKDACDIFQEEKVDLIITDVVMPEMDGLEFISYIRKDCQNDTPVIVITGDPLYKKILTVSKLLGAKDFIEKGFDQEELLGRVKEQLNISQ